MVNEFILVTPKIRQQLWISTVTMICVDYDDTNYGTLCSIDV